MAAANHAKLGIKPGARLRVGGSGAGAAHGSIGSLPDGVTLQSEGEADIVLLFAESLAEVDRAIDQLYRATAPGGRLWVAYRKGAGRKQPNPEVPPLHRDTLQSLLAEHGLQGVTLVALDDVWSALRVRPS